MVHRPLGGDHGTNSLPPQNGDVALAHIDVKPQIEVEVELDEGVLDVDESGPETMVLFHLELVAMVSSPAEEGPQQG